MSLAESELHRIMASTGAARMQGLIKLTRTNSRFAPGWAALAEEHWASRRREEALQAAKKALRLDPKLHHRFSIELRLASRPILAEIAPPKVKVIKTQSAPMGDTPGESGGARSNQMLDTALKLNDRDERVAVLEDLKELTPNDPAVLFHLAKELAVVGRSEDARQAGDELRKVAPDRYTELYAWANSSLPREQAEYEARSGGRRKPAPSPKPSPRPAPVRAQPGPPKSTTAPPPPPKPTSPPPRLDPTPRPPPRSLHRAQPDPRMREPRGEEAATRPVAKPIPSAHAGPPPNARPKRPPPERRRGPERPVRPSDPAETEARTTVYLAHDKPQSTLDRVIDSIGEQIGTDGEFDEAATVDVALENIGLDDGPGEQEEDVTARAQLKDLKRPRQPDGDNETVRLHLSELQKLVTASVDPKLDES